jgi:hypothetical protein
MRRERTVYGGLIHAAHESFASVCIMRDTYMYDEWVVSMLFFVKQRYNASRLTPHASRRRQPPTPDARP